MVDLPEENREAAVNAITLPEVFHNFENFQIDLEDLELEEQLANSMVSGRSFSRCSKQYFFVRGLAQNCSS